MPDRGTNARLEEIERKYQMMAGRLKKCSNRTQPFVIVRQKATRIRGGGT